MHSSPYGAAGGGLKGTFPNPSIVPEDASLVISGRAFATHAVPVAASSSAAGVLHWTEAETTAAPNTTSFSAVSWTPNTTAAQANAVIKPKGNQGGVLAAIPDNSNTGGNLRGRNSVDLQSARSNATSCASGNYAVVAGGLDNTASGTNSVSCGGESNTASGDHAIVVGGNTNTADGAYSFIPGGRNATTRGLTGKSAHATGIFSGVGDAQAGKLVCRLLTSDATVSSITADGAAASTSNIDVMPNGSVYQFLVQVAARSSSDQRGWLIRGIAQRGFGGAGSTTVVGQTQDVWGSAGSAAWVATVVADTSNGGICVQATGVAATQIHWVAVHHTAEEKG